MQNMILYVTKEGENCYKNKGKRRKINEINFYTM